MGNKWNFQCVNCYLHYLRKIRGLFILYVLLVP